MHEGIERLKDHFEQFKGTKLSEVDAQVLYIEVVLHIAGYDLRNPKIVKRADRAKNMYQFDVEVYESEADFKKCIGLAIECKSPQNDEFNIAKYTSGTEVGALEVVTQQGNRIWKNKNRDGLGQLRAYCLNARHFIAGSSIPILTNGFEWVVVEDGVFSCLASANQPLPPGLKIVTANLDCTEDMVKLIDVLHRWCPANRSVESGDEH